MRFGQLMTRFATLLLALAVVCPHALFAQESAQPPAQAPVFKKEELQQLLAPVALYPDQLLAQVLMASTYPLQIAQADRWQKENSKLTGAALDKALGAKEWDPSVKSLVPFPQVLKMMSDKLEWTQKLGDAFLAQQADVMSEVQYLRAKAQEAGTLKTNTQQKVSTQPAPAAAAQKQIIVIEPASPQVVYVPVYNPTVVYGSWWYPTYPPYYYPPPPGSAFVAGVFWGAAIATSANYYGWGNCNWNSGNINVNVNQYNSINVNNTNINNANINKKQITSSTWQHDPANRGQVPYKDAKSREQFAPTAKPATAAQQARGYAPSQSGTRDTSKPAAAGQSTPGTRDVPNANAGNRPAATDNAARPSPNTQMAKDAQRPAAKQSAAPSPSAFDVNRGSDVRAQADRGRSSVQSMDRQGGGRAAGGGGGGGGRRR